MERRFDKVRSGFISEFQDLLPKIRSKQVEESTLTNVLQDYNESPYEKEKFLALLDARKKEIGVKIGREKGRHEMISCFLLRLHMDLFFCFTTDDGDVSLHCCRAAGIYWDLGQNWGRISRIEKDPQNWGMGPQNFGSVP